MSEGVERTRKDGGLVRFGERSSGDGGEEGLYGLWAEAMAQKGQSESTESPMMTAWFSRLGCVDVCL